LKNTLRIVISGPNDTQEHRVQVGEKERVSFGKTGADFSLPGAKKVSRVHLYFTQENGEFFVVDNKGAGGIFVNGERTEKRALQKGDMIKFGDCSIEILDLPKRASSSQAPASQPSEPIEQAPLAQTMIPTMHSTELVEPQQKEVHSRTEAPQAEPSPQEQPQAAQSASSASFGIEPAINTEFFKKTWRDAFRDLQEPKISTNWSVGFSIKIIAFMAVLIGGWKGLISLFPVWGGGFHAFTVFSLIFAMLVPVVMNVFISLFLHAISGVVGMKARFENFLSFMAAFAVLSLPVVLVQILPFFGGAVSLVFIFWGLYAFYKTFQPNMLLLFILVFAVCGIPILAAMYWGAFMHLKQMGIGP